MTTQPAATIIGGGIVGLSAALELQARGWSVRILDRGEPKGRASYGNAGVISRSSIFPVANAGTRNNILRYLLAQDIAVRVRISALPSLALWLRRFLATASQQAWENAALALNPMVAQALERHLVLGERTGSSRLIRHTGFLRLYRKAENERAAAREKAVLAGHGVTVEVLNAHAIAALEPSLARRFEAGWVFPQSASVDSPGQVVDLYRQHFLAGGGEWIDATVNSIAPDGDGFAVRAEGQALSASRVILAGGIGSAHLARQLGYRIPLAAERGYHQHIAFAPGTGLSRPVFDAEGGYVISPMEGAARVLSGSELTRHQAPANHQQIDAVTADAARTVGLDLDSRQPIWMGSRPATPDGLPVIGRAAHHANLLFAFGHGHIGFANGPITGLLVAQLLAGEALAVPIAPFSAGRFARPSGHRLKADLHQSMLRWSQ